jgi:hypothetical protein
MYLVYVLYMGRLLTKRFKSEFSTSWGNWFNDSWDVVAHKTKTSTSRLSFHCSSQCRLSCSCHGICFIQDHNFEPWATTTTENNFKYKAFSICIHFYFVYVHLSWWQMKLLIIINNILIKLMNYAIVKISMLTLYM